MIARSERNEIKRLALWESCRANARLRGLVTPKYNASTPLRHSQARATSPKGRGFGITILGRGRRLDDPKQTGAASRSPTEYDVELKQTCRGRRPRRPVIKRREHKKPSLVREGGPR